MSDVILSAGVRSNLNSLQSTASLLATTQQRLATGREVNSALDDATNFFTSQSLSNRAGDLSNLLDGISNATQTLQAADNGIQAITDLVENAQATARQAQTSSGTNGTVSSSGLGAALDTDLTGGLGTGGVGGVSFDVGDVITVTDGTQTSSLTLGATSTVQDLIDNVNTTTDLDVSASLTAGGELQFESTLEAGGSVTVAVTDSTTTTANDVASLGITTATATGTVNADRAAFAAQFDDLRTQINQLASDASFNGVNLLSGDSLTVNFNENGSSSLDVSGVSLDSDGLGINATGSGFQDDASIEASLAELETALGTLRTQSSAFGSNLSVVETRESFTNDLVNTLQVGADSLVLADTNQEGANLLALQTRQSLSTTALSLASQSDQNVLRLF